MPDAKTRPTTALPDLLRRGLWSVRCADGEPLPLARRALDALRSVDRAAQIALAGGARFAGVVRAGRVAAAPLEPGTRLATPSDPPLRLERPAGTGLVRLRYVDEALELPESEAPLLERLAAAGAFTAGEVQGWGAGPARYPWGDVEAFLTTLEARGFVWRVDASPWTGRLLGELPLDAFLGDHWDATPAYLPDPGHRLQGLDVGWARIQAALAEATPDDPTLRSGRTDRTGRFVHEPIGRDAVDAEAARATVCVGDTGARLPSLAPLLASLERDLGLPGIPRVNAYRSADGLGYPVHLDRHPIFVLQVEGRKRWRYSREAAIRWPPGNLGAVDLAEAHARGELQDLHAPVGQGGDELVTCVLEPGDVLYLPGGHWHTAAALGYSHALTIQCPTATVVERAVAAMRDVLDGPEDFPDAIAGLGAAQVLEARPGRIG